VSRNTRDNLKLSVVMPVRNGEKYISNSTRMIIENCNPQDEIIIVDDGSTDGTYSELMRLKTESSNLRVIKTKGLGIVSALNLGILEATNPLIARFDVDDFYSPARLNSQRNLLVNNTIGAFTDYEFVNQSGRESLGIMPSPVSAPAVALSLVNSQRTAHPSSIFRKDAWFSAGRYREKDFPAEDLSLWLRMLRIGQLVSVPEVYLKYRIHNSSVTSSNREKAESRKEQLLREIGFPPSYFKDVDWMEIYNNYENYSLGSERRVLLIYDFVTLMKRNRKLINLSEIQVGDLLLKQNLDALCRLRKDKKLRKNFRNDIKPIG